MLNILLLSRGDVLGIIMVGALIGVPFFTFLTFLFRDTAKKLKEERAREKQHLMFNQLKKGDYVWEVVDDNIITRIVDTITYRFNSSNECTGIFINTYRPHNSYDTRYIDIKLKDSKVFKYQHYYTLYGEASVTAKAVKNKRDKEMSKAVEYTIDDIKNASDEVTKRLEKVVNQYK